MNPKPNLRMPLRTIISKFPDYCRNNLYRISCLAIILFVSALFLAGCNDDTKKKPRNIIIVVSDDVGAEQLESYANELQYSSSFDPAKLPNIHRLVTAGIRFRQAWSNPSCSPTRAGIYTGEYSCTHGIYDPTYIGAGLFLQPSSIDPPYIPLPKSMDLAGSSYETALFGKWHLGQRTATDYDLPRDDGFDHYAGSIGGNLESYIEWTKVIDGIQQSPKITNHATLDLASDAQDWINDRAIKQTPFFAILAFNAGHWTGSPSAKEWAYDQLSTHCTDITKFDPSSTDREIYKAQLHCMDVVLGDLIDFMKNNHPAVLDNTIIVFIGDNGTEEDVGEEIIGTGGMKVAAKSTLKQGGVHIPFIIADGHYLTKPEYRKTTAATSVGFITTPGTTCDALIHTRDLYGTVRELAGIASPDAATESHSLVRFMTNPLARGEQYVFTEGKEPCEFAIRNDNFKLIRYSSGTEEFYKIGMYRWDETNLLPTSGMTGAELRAYNNLEDKLKLLPCYCPTK
jgi:arylsulfatase A-like enzyme